ncbi:glycoside hydrolase family 108 protein [Muricoccus vinaceus]|uniref:Glycoside hydrolase family 108 protein n=1 Tax=Muricoccus vinaceus TaxID=424704 RepID=A0ABV6IL14_9PROT
MSSPFLYAGLTPPARLASLAAELADAAGALAGYSASPAAIPFPTPPGAPAPALVPAIARFDACLDFTLLEEGGFANNPRDKGKATNMGITIATLTRWRQRADPSATVTVADVRALTRAEARQIYFAWYWNANRCEAMPIPVDLTVFDFAVNSGGAIREIQERLGVQADGVVGHLTLTAMQRFDPTDLAERICDVRMEYLRSLESWADFQDGWTARVERVRAQARKLALAA